LEPKKPNDIWQPLLFSGILIIGMFLGFKLAKQNGNQNFSKKTSSQLDGLIQLLSAKYVDSIDEKKLYRSGIEGILKNLDPHTVYIPASEVGRANEELEGQFYGIGVEFYNHDDTVTISSIIQNGPSDNKNIQPGDKIIRIDDSIIAGKKLEDDAIIQRIRGDKNTAVKLTLLALNHELKTVDITRGNVPLKSIPAYFKVNDETGFIKIIMFSETTYDEFKTALADLVKQNIKHLIIDVRDNPGGYMDAVANVADELVAGVHTIVSTKGKERKDSLVTSIDGLFEKGNLCILVDENSASASEILAGAIQDLDRGLIIGRRTFGKGLVQEQFELPDHSAIRITTARYYLPSGRCIQRNYENGKEKYKHDIIDRYSNGSLYANDSVSKTSKIFYTLKKKPVYGDEGIRPDEFIPLDTIYHAQLNDFYLSHAAEEFSFNYYYFNQKEFSSFKNLEQFVQTFSMHSNLQNALTKYFHEHKLNVQILESPQYLKEINSSIKAQFAKILFGNNGKFKVQLSDDAFILKAIQKMRVAN